MLGSSFGTLSTNAYMMQQNRQIKNKLEALSQQLVTGQVTNVTHRLNGDFHELADIEHRLKILKHHKQSLQQAATMMAVTQQALKNIQDTKQAMHNKLRQSDQLFKSTVLNGLKYESKAAFDTVISTLNTQVAGRTLFSGAALATPALADAKNMYSDLKAAIRGMTTADNIAAAVHDWFNSPTGGFETAGYLGSHTKAGPIQFSKGQDVNWPIKADDASLRPTLHFLALAALALDTDITIFKPERLAMVKKSTAGFDKNPNDLIDLQAHIGALEARISRTQTNQSSERSSLELAKTALIGVDKYDITLRFEAANNQLKALYTLTSRLSKLSLIDYLR